MRVPFEWLRWGWAWQTHTDTRVHCPTLTTRLLCKAKLHVQPLKCKLGRFSFARYSLGTMLQGYARTQYRGNPRANIPQPRAYYLVALNSRNQNLLLQPLSHPGESNRSQLKAKSGLQGSLIMGYEGPPLHDV